jgi:hypothetical protein
VTLCSPVDFYRFFGGTYYIHLHDRRRSLASSNAIVYDGVSDVETSGFIPENPINGGVIDWWN